MADTPELNTSPLEKPKEPRNIGELAQKFWYHTPFIEDVVMSKVWEIWAGDRFESMDNHTWIIVYRWANKIEIKFGPEYVFKNSIPLGKDVSLKKSGKYFELDYPGLTWKESFTIEESKVPDFRREFAKLQIKYTDIQSKRLLVESLDGTTIKSMKVATIGFIDRLLTMEKWAVQAFVKDNPILLGSIHYPSTDKEKIASLTKILDRTT